MGAGAIFDGSTWGDSESDHCLCECRPWVVPNSSCNDCHPTCQRSAEWVAIVRGIGHGYTEC